MSFVHLNVSSAFSGHYGVTRPELIAEAAATQFRALAITDRDGLYGAIKHIAACLHFGIVPIVGVNLAITDEEGLSLGRCVILAHGQNRGVGWRKLCQLISEAHQNQRTKAIAISRSRLAEIIGEDGGLTILLGNETDVGTAVLNDQAKTAKLLLTKWASLFQARASLAIEITSHLTEPKSKYSTEQAARMLQLADAFQLPAVLTNAVRYLTPDEALTADILDAARMLAPLGEFEGQANAQAWLKPTTDMQNLAAEICEDTDRTKRLLSDTEQLANLCGLDPAKDCDWGKPKTPEKELLGITDNPFEVLWQKTHSAINLRYPTAKQNQLLQVTHRLNQELITINQLGFATYFLTVADVAQMIRDMNIRLAARGSGAGSLVNYLLGISSVDPVEHDLLFERFLSTERSSLPDIDIDVESARRHDIYRAIFKRYGSERVTLLSMQNKYRGRGAMRDSGLALGLDEEEIDEIAKNMWRFSARSFRSALEKKPELAEMAKQVEQDRKLNLLVDLTERLDRIPRHISMHPCGVILGNQQLLSLTPVEPSGMGLPMSQFDKDDMDPMGMLKLDVLGVRMQSAMAYAISEIERTRKVRIDLDSIRKDDEETFRQIRTTNTLGIFQIESPGQRELTGKHQPTEFNDLTIQISLFRPGPMKGNMIAPYLDGRHGFAKPHYIHPDLEPILRETYGVVIFHEHVLKIFKTMTGCSLARADELRRSLENPRLKPQIEQFFREKGALHGYSTEVINEVWQILEGFSSFGFCKAHGAAFALPTYQSAWLKTHYPTEFLAGLFTHDPGMYPKRLLLAEARRLGVKILPIDINQSSTEYRVVSAPRKTTDPNEPDIGIRLALTEIQGVSEAEIKRIISNQPFDSLADFYLRAKPSRRTFERLALLGAFDELAKQSGDVTRGDVLARVRQLNAIKNRPTFEGNSALDFTVLEQLPTGNADFDSATKVQHELELAKLDFSEHLIEQFRPMLDDLGVVHSSELAKLRNKTDVLVAGVRVATQTPPMRSGKRVVFITLDDGYGCSDATFFDEAQKRASHILFNNRLLVIAGKTRRTGVNGVSLMAENAWDLRELWRQWQQKKDPLAS
ncbi:DNA polymerase III subunit alpha [Candidatus Rhodoluna planktonica]|uniref:DNA-directed DNA polymerase n=1 Tax=Candidatus Rhodoluna planktonica TaxID=535712 RepID=A0A1D9DYP7_9MICO|nr:DNA polymerase III subunit alpha [Candidatus Rhodoluna planktonica]AOY55936.1 DNA polymerase III subunit alpha [Candidatus Rhodoluna planktonica]